MKWIRVTIDNMPNEDVLVWSRTQGWKIGSLDYDGHFYALGPRNELIKDVTH